MCHQQFVSINCSMPQRIFSLQRTHVLRDGAEGDPERHRVVARETTVGLNHDQIKHTKYTSKYCDLENFPLKRAQLELKVL